MNPGSRPKIAVLGLGNLMRTDDGVGIHAIRRLLESGQLPPEVEVIDGGTLGLDLLPRLEAITHLAALDAVDFGGPPGALTRFANRDLLTLPTSKSAHLLGFADLVSALQLLGRAPAKIVLLGVQPESTDWGVTLSSSVAGALDELLEAVLSEVAEWLDRESATVTLYRDTNHI